jgi:hypothetical protein
MDPLTLIASALVAGVAAGGKDAASAAVRDSFTALRNLLRRRTAAHAEATAAIAAAEQDPDGGDVAKLAAALAGARLGEDIELRVAAEALLARLDSDAAGSRIDLRHAKGVQVGDHGTQTNTFG